MKLKKLPFQARILAGKMFGIINLRDESSGLKNKEQALQDLKIIYLDGQMPQTCAGTN